MEEWNDGIMEGWKDGVLININRWKINLNKIMGKKNFLRIIQHFIIRGNTNVSYLEIDFNFFQHLL